MENFFNIIGMPLGVVMGWMFGFLNDYFLTIFLFTLLVRICLFPLSLKQQKATMDRARLAPRLERLQKKYGQDRQKLMEKQQELYERHGVKMTPGCMPMLLQMVILMGVIAVIYAPLTTLANPKLDDAVVSVSQQAVAKEEKLDYKKQFDTGYYGELRLMLKCDEGNNQKAIIAALENPTDEQLKTAYANHKNLKDGKPADQRKAFEAALKKAGGAEAVYKQMDEMSAKFNLFGSEKMSMLEAPWVSGVKFKDNISWLWLIPLISGITSFGVSFISMRFSKRSMPQNQPGQGCTNNMMLIYMPAFSTFIAFTVPGAVGIYWIFSNLISGVQTVILNKIYDPGKARQQAEAEMAERRRKKAEDKKRLAMARQREEAEARKAEQALERQREESREMNKKKKKKGSSSAAKATEETAQDNTEDNGTTDAVDTQPVDNTDEQPSAE